MKTPFNALASEPRVIYKTRNVGQSTDFVRVVLPSAVDQAALTASRENPPRMVENLDNVSPDRGAKPSKGLFRSGKRIA